MGGALFAHFGDRVGRKAMLIFSLGLMSISTFCVGLLPSYDTIGLLAPLLLISFGFSVGMFAWAAIFGPLGAFFSELFDTRLRYSGAALRFALRFALGGVLGGALGGALAPLLAVRLFTAIGSITWISAYLFVMALISLTAIYSLRETRGDDLAEIGPDGSPNRRPFPLPGRQKCPTVYTYRAAGSYVRRAHRAQVGGRHTLSR